MFSKTAGFRHQSIPKGIETFKKLALQYKWDIVYSEDSSLFNTSILQYDVLVFLNTTGDILNEDRQNVLKEYMAKGKGFVGIHAATDTEHDWPWYNDMVGAVFASHPKIQTATLKTSENYKAFFGQDFKTRQVKDEWYNFKDPLKPGITVLTYLDEGSYTGGKQNGNHPITWFHKYGGGRAFYTGLGHTDEQYDDETFLQELVTAINWAGGKKMKRK